MTSKSIYSFTAQCMPELDCSIFACGSNDISRKADQGVHHPRVFLVGRHAPGCKSFPHLQSAVPGTCNNMLITSKPANRSYLFCMLAINRNSFSCRSFPNMRR